MHGRRSGSESIARHWYTQTRKGIGASGLAEGMQALPDRLYGSWMLNDYER